MPPTARTERGIDVDTGRRRLSLGTGSVRALAGFVLERERVPSAMLSIAFVSRTAIAELNRRHLGHDGDTDVITFALGRATPAAPLVGDIYVAPDVVREQARRWGVPVREELARVVVHGVLHALGHDHPEGATRERSPMWKRQERWLAAARAEGVW
ncbi:MAG TPA: rRNA maturation RNase YbeY [Gemmatimonadaceae bacterium]